MCHGMLAPETRWTGSGYPVDGLLAPLLLMLILPSGQASGCPRPAAVQHGWANRTETNQGSFSPGTVLLYSCEPGYTMEGGGTVICSASGIWSPGPPRCVRGDVCPPPFQPENGGYNCHPSPCRRLTQGTVIEYFCDEGYALKGDYKYLTCQNGEWDSVIQISCHLGQGMEPVSSLGMSTLSIVASTASSVALVLLLVVLFVLLQPKLKSFHHSRREQGVSGQPASILVEGVQVSLPSYEEAVSGSRGDCSLHPPPESRVQIVLSEGPQDDMGESSGQVGAQAALPSSSSHNSETVLVHQAPPCTSSSSSSCGAGQYSTGDLHSDQHSDQHSLLSLASAEDFADDIPLLKEA